MRSTSNRRQFLAASAAIAGSLALGRKASAQSSLEKFRTAHIGVGGMGGSDLGSIASHANVEIAAICDVDSNILAQVAEKFPMAKPYTDFREMLAEMDSSIDGVVVSTPDHTHASAAMTAMNANKPVYCQKPLTHDVFEARQLRIIAEEKGLVTQMGIQIHSHPAYRRAVKMIRDGVIGKVSEVHAWSNKNWGFDGEELPAAAEVPANLDWNLWLGTAAEREFIPRVYHPGQWRKLIDFGTGTLGDMGVHIFDTPYTALKLTAPDVVVTTCREPTHVGHPEKNIVQYVFPQTEYTTERMVWRWYDGGFAPPAATDVGLPEGTGLPGQGSLFVGEEGHLLLPHIGEAILFPEEKFADYARPEVEANNHYHQWVDACAGEDEASAPFALGGPLTEALLLGVVANRFPGEAFTWDAENMRTDSDNANALLRREYREGFEVENLQAMVAG